MPNRKKHSVEKYARYKAEDRKEKNKQRKLRKVARQQPNNKQVTNLLEK